MTEFMISGDFDSVTDMVAALQDPDRQVTVRMVKRKYERPVLTEIKRRLAKNHRHQFSPSSWTYGKYGRQDVHVHDCLDEDCGRVLIGDGRKCDGSGASHHRETL